MSIYQEAASSVRLVSAEEKEQVMEQLDRLLATHHFRNSKRYPALLRFIVLETLDGRGEFLKERLLGVRVFDRPADYDTAADPIVRVTIAEIRKRIAQYYHAEGHDSELRIDLQPGSYTPEFRVRSLASTGNQMDTRLEEEPATQFVTAVTLPEAAPAEALQSEDEPATWRRWFVSTLLLCCMLVAGLLLAAYGWLHFQPSAAEQFWGPLMGSENPILFCIPTDVGSTRGPANVPGNVLLSNPPGGPPSFLSHEVLGENVVFSDVLATLSITKFLALHHQRSRAKLNKWTDLQDLRQGPVVLIGGLSNQWTLSATKPLRFAFHGDQNETYWISDSRNPSNRDWSVNLKLPVSEVTRDYAIVTRLHNQQTGEMEVIVAGIGMSGTAAAGEFVTNESMLRELRQKIGPAFKERDFEVVLSTEVANGSAGSPKILEVEVF